MEQAAAEVIVNEEAKEDLQENLPFGNKVSELVHRNN